MAPARKTAAAARIGTLARAVTITAPAGGTIAKAGRRRGSASRDDRAEQDAPRRRVLEDGADERTVLVEARRRANDRHDAVGVRELEEAVDRLIAHLGHDIAQLVLRGELVGELLAP